MVPQSTKVLLLTALLISSPVVAHHAFIAVYDPQQIVEIDGEVVSVAWHNPHISLTISGAAIDERAVLWQIEGN